MSEWRCEWCGKPHEENDPPCDNCGHGSFERAVVPRTDLAEGGREPTLVWVCTECGREHPKNAPPCSRCGNGTLEKRRQKIDESELAAPGYRELLTPGYAAALAAVALVAVVFALGLAGVISLPGAGGDGLAVEGTVPGNATDAGGTDLAAIEQAYLTTLADRQPAAGLERSGTLDELATYANQQRLAWLVDPEAPTAERSRSFFTELDERLTETCSTGGTQLAGSVDYGPGEDPAALADRLVAAVGDDDPAEAATVGIDLHAFDGRIYIWQLSCGR